MIRKLSCTAVAFAAALLLTAGHATAGVVNSKHDMSGVTGITWSATQGGAGACSFCHIPHKATGAKLWSGAPAGTAATIGTIGTLCADCHLPVSGKFASSKYVALGKLFFNVTGTTMASAAHGMTKANIPTGDVNLATTAVTGLRYTGATGELEAGMIQCSTCHDPHNDALDPFIDADAGANYNELCKLCHTGRNSATMGFGASGSAGTHPVGDTLTDAAEGADNPITYGASFNRAFRSDGQVVTAEMAWLSGGHTHSGATSGGTQCGTCHAIHGEEATTQDTITIGSTPLTAGVNRAIGTNRYNQSISLLVLSNPDYAASALCQGCHTDQTGANGWNPGAASTVSHPVNAALTAAGSTVYGPGTTAIVGTDGTAVAVCRSCHGVHTKNAKAPGAASTPLLLAAVSTACDTCHPSSETFFNGHHPANVAWVGTMATAAAGNTPTLDDANWGLSQLECYSCHRAHNANTSNLRMADKHALCAVCHLDNPCVAGSTADGTTTGGQGSHFIGAITTANYKYTGLWPSTGGTSEYTTGGTNGNIVCLSCHNLMNQNLGQTGSGHLLLGGYGNNFVPSDTAEGLCRTCHKPAQDVADGEAWDTGWAHPNTAASVIQKTHPLEENIAGVAVATTANPVKANTTVSYSTGTVQVNCESCHVAHCATSSTGSLILELGVDPGTGTVGPVGNVATPFNTKPTASKNNDGLCNACHTY